MLVAPTVVAPLTPWSRSVRVTGQLDGATVTVFANGAQVGQSVVDGGDAFVPLVPGARLATGQLVTARQEFDGETSGAVPDPSAVPVLAEPTPAHLGSLFTRSAVLECGSCLWLSGAVPGAEVEVSVGGAPPVTVTAEWTGVHVDIPPVGRGTVVTCRQRHGAVSGPPVTLPPVLPLPADRRATTPSLEEPLYTCQRIVTVTGVMPGAELALDHAGDAHSVCFGATRGRVRLARGLVRDEALTVSQRFPECGVEGEPSRSVVTGDVPPTPSWAHPVCRSDREVEVDGLVPGAVVQFVRGPGSGDTIRARVGEDQRRFLLPPFGNTLQLGVQQVLCGGGPWSDIAWITLGDAGSPDAPAIVEPVYSCATAVGVARLSAGTKVTVVSARWGGPIGDVVAIGDEYTTVPLLFPATAGDRLSLRLLRCGLPRDVAGWVEVRPAPPDLHQPRLDEPVDDAGGAITVDGLLPGAICDVEVLDRPDAPAGVLVASVPVILPRAAVPVPPIPPGRFVRARQRLCGLASAPSEAAKTGDVRPPYVADSADRVMAMTGTRGAGERPPRYDSRTVGLNGTDLGISAVHDGRLYFLFGDADHALMPDGNVVGAVSMFNADPIAWTTDGPRTPGGPWLHFVTTPAGYFRRLAVDGLPPLEGFCVPTGAFSYHGRLYVFVADETMPDDGPDTRMNSSHLAVTKQPGGIEQSLNLLYDVASTLHDDFPAGRWLVHASPTVVKCADWPGLPAAGGDGVVVFGTSLYHKSNMFLAFFPLRYTGVAMSPALTEPPIPSPATWLYFTGFDGTGRPQWMPAAALGGLVGPTPLLPLPELGDGLGEVTATWIPALRRWMTLHPSPAGVQVRTARNPWGPWSAGATVFDGDNVALHATADNLVAGHRFVGLNHKDGRRTGVYAPYLIAPWTEYDRSTRTLTIVYALSTEPPPYNVQLMTATLRYV